ncbi:MAG TPA: AAC(3) family N-acetyltransferase [Sandaracinaceae bacterium LLY-WYZ-13_1]|nr:AAC(3) family N-acetyltransferase [Sandaracinaceae bacterium LLY-WYZ-13_1]
MAAPVTAAAIARDLRALGVEPGDVLLAHVSLSRIAGPRSMVVGGPVAVLEGLLDTVGATGTLVMPAFSADYSDPAEWTNPPVPRAWWPTVREHMPAWRADRARTFKIGWVAQTFRAWRGVRRSAHPKSSFCALGPRAAEITTDVPLDDPLGPRGPLGRLRRMGARVALIGCGFSACTAFHLAEHETAHPPARVTSAAPMARDGSRAWVRWSEPRYDAASFAAIGASWTGSAAPREGRVGAAETQLFELGAAVDHAVRWMDRRG